MKIKLKGVLGVAVSLVLMLSLLMAIPVSADVTQPAVTLGDSDISDPSEYTVMFQVNKEIVEAGGWIEVEFPDGTELPATADWVTGDVQIKTTAGFGVENANTSIPGGVGGHVITTGNVVRILLDSLPVDADPVTPDDVIGEFAMVKVYFGPDDINPVLENPDDPDDYTLWVSTSAEKDAVESAPYTVGAPDVGALPGIVQVFNPSEILISQTTGDNAISAAILAAGEDFVIKIGPGTYSTDILDTADDGVTFRATGAADVTIIKLDAIIDMDKITLDGLTFQGQMTISGDECTITDCIFEKSEDNNEILLSYDAVVDYTGDVTDCTFDTTNEDADEDVGIAVGNPGGLTISNCSFVVDDEDCAVGGDHDFKVEDCEFIGSSGIGVGVWSGQVTVSGSTFDGLDNAVIVVNGDVQIKNNTITNCSGDATSRSFGLSFSGAGGVIDIENTAGLLVYGNTISDTDEDEYAVVVEASAGAVFIIFNNFSGNEKNIDNNDTSVELDASNNWWDDADGPDSDSISGDVDTTPALGAAVTAAKVDTAPADDILDAKTDVGVKVSANDIMDIVGAAIYADNPGTATEDPAVGFFDVYVEGTSLTKVTIRLYGDVTADSKVMVWSTLEGAWVEASDQGASTFGGYVWCTVKDDETVPLIEELGGTPFAIVSGAPAEPEEQLPVLLVAPGAGITGVQLSPTFAWTDVGTPFYEFQLSDNPYFADPLVSDSPKLRAPYFDYPADLDYSRTYFWRVRSSISGATSVCVGTQCGPWAMGIFTTLDEPVEPPEIIFPEPQPPVVIPPVQEIAPTWIYVIIGVGALLVIAVIVLIVTTRRATP